MSLGFKISDRAHAPLQISRCGLHHRLASIPMFGSDTKILLSLPRSSSCFLPKEWLWITIYQRLLTALSMPLVRLRVSPRRKLLVPSPRVTSRHTWTDTRETQDPCSARFGWTLPYIIAPRKRPDVDFSRLTDSPHHRKCLPRLQ